MCCYNLIIVLVLQLISVYKQQRIEEKLKAEVRSAHWFYNKISYYLAATNHIWSETSKLMFEFCYGFEEEAVGAGNELLP